MYTIIKYGGDGKPYNYTEFLCDSADDVATLPVTTKGSTGCAIGSKAYISSTGDVYILNNSNTWAAVSSSSSGSEIDSDSIATLNEVTNYLNL